MILGFGQPDIDAKNQFKINLGGYLKEELGAADFNSLDCFVVRKILDEFSKSLSRHEFNGKSWGYADNIFFEFTKEYNKVLIICHGNYWRYDNNHPFSPDGFASLGIPYVLSLLVRENPEQDYPKDSCLYEERVEIFSE